MGLLSLILDEKEVLGFVGEWVLWILFVAVVVVALGFVDFVCVSGFLRKAEQIWVCLICVILWLIMGDL